MEKSGTVLWIFPSWFWEVSLILFYFFIYYLFKILFYLNSIN